MATHNSFINVFLKIPGSQEDYNNKYTTLNYIAVNIGYTSNIIDTILYYQ